MTVDENTQTSLVLLEPEAIDVSFSESKKGPRKLLKRTLVDRMLIISQGIEISRRNMELRNELDRCSFGEDRFLEGVELVKSVENLMIERDEKLKIQKVATLETTKKRREVHKYYIRFVSLARVVFKENPRIYGILGLKGEYIRNYSGWIFQVKHFFEFALGESEIVEEFAKYNVSREDLEYGVKMVNDFEVINMEKIRCSALAQDATYQRDREFKRLLAWWREYKRVVTTVVEKNPHLKIFMSEIVPVWK